MQTNTSAVIGSFGSTLSLEFEDTRLEFSYFTLKVRSRIADIYRSIQRKKLLESKELLSESEWNSARERYNERVNKGEYDFDSDNVQTWLKTTEGTYHTVKALLADHHPNMDERTFERLLVTKTEELGLILREAIGFIAGQSNPKA